MSGRGRVGAHASSSRAVWRAGASIAAAGAAAQADAFRSSVMPGYFPPTEDSTGVLRDGWLNTGDLGYWSSDEIVITGRAKDLIIVNGRNIWPQDIEWSVECPADPAARRRLRLLRQRWRKRVRRDRRAGASR